MIELPADWRSWPARRKEEFVRRHEARETFRALDTDSAAYLRRFRGNPVGYSQAVLNIRWWHKQKEIANAIHKYPRVLVKAGHNIGKSFLLGSLINYHFDCYNPGITLTSAPTSGSVSDISWREVRSQRKTNPPLLPKAPRLQGFRSDGKIDPDHFAAGMTARTGSAFQGRHDEFLFVIFDEAQDIDKVFWDAADSMLSSGDGNRMLAVINPLTTDCEAYRQQQDGGWHVITVSVLDHPNVTADLRGLRRPFPKAIGLAWIEAMFHRHGTPIPKKEKASDVCWPPEDFCQERGITPQWYRPKSELEARVLGRFPAQAIENIWSDAMWEAAIAGSAELKELAKRFPPEIGCDVARYGDDMTAIHVRRGPLSLHHEDHSKIGTHETAGRLKQLCDRFGKECGIDARKIHVKVDDDGVGGGVVDQKGPYRFFGMGAGSKANDPDRFPNRRSELWFDLAERAEECNLDLSLIPDWHAQLERQFKAPKFKYDSAGRKVVEPKDETKKKIKRSCDDADSANLAYAPPNTIRPNVY